MPCFCGLSADLTNGLPCELQPIRYRSWTSAECRRLGPPPNAGTRFGVLEHTEHVPPLRTRLARNDRLSAHVGLELNDRYACPAQAPPPGGCGSRAEATPPSRVRARLPPKHAVDSPIPGLSFRKPRRVHRLRSGAQPSSSVRGRRPATRSRSTSRVFCGRPRAQN